MGKKKEATTGMWRGWETPKRCGFKELLKILLRKISASLPFAD